MMGPSEPGDLQLLRETKGAAEGERMAEPLQPGSEDSPAGPNADNTSSLKPQA